MRSIEDEIEEREIMNVINEFRNYCSLDDLRKCYEKVSASKDIDGRNTYNKKMKMIRAELRELGYKDIPFRSGYYKEKY